MSAPQDHGPRSVTSSEAGSLPDNKEGRYEGRASDAAYRNHLAKKVGTISNKIEAEQERHKNALAKLVEQLDAVYEQLGAEAAE